MFGALSGWGVPTPGKNRAFKTITTNDGVNIAYEVFGSGKQTILLIHGWSGSRNYWDRNARDLAKRFTVYVVDLRFHGDSDKPPFGYHIARLAADLRDLLTALDLSDVTVVGASMGASIIWSYIELFGPDRLGKAVFVDQAPLQNLAADWSLGSKGCYDAVSLTRLQAALQYDIQSVATGNIEGCLTIRLGNSAEQALVDETLRADAKALGLLMADHTQLDWRPLLPRITIPCLNLVGGVSGVFPVEGVKEVGRLVKHCHTIVFAGANHWLYLEQPDVFNTLLSDFAMHGVLGVKHVVQVPP